MSEQYGGTSRWTLYIFAAAVTLVLHLCTAYPPQRKHEVNMVTWYTCPGTSTVPWIFRWDGGNMRYVSPSQYALWVVV